MANSFQELTDHLNNGELGHNHIQIAYRAWLRQREDLPVGIRDLLGGKNETDAGLVYTLFRAISQAIGVCELANRRGNHGGIHDAYLSICEEYPEAAQALLDKFRMDKEGVITL